MGKSHIFKWRKTLANYVQSTSESPWLISLCFPRSNPSTLASAIKLLSFPAFPSTPVTDPYVPPRRRTPRPTRSCRRIAAHPDRPLPSAHRPLFGSLDPASPAYARVTFVPMRSQSVPPESVSDSRPVRSSRASLTVDTFFLAWFCLFPLSLEARLASASSSPSPALLPSRPSYSSSWVSEPSSVSS